MTAHRPAKVGRPSVRLLYRSKRGTQSETSESLGAAPRSREHRRLQFLRCAAMDTPAREHEGERMDEKSRKKQQIMKIGRHLGAHPTETDTSAYELHQRVLTREETLPVQQMEVLAGGTGGDKEEESRESWLEDLRLRFKAADLDGDGVLNVEELRNVLECTDQFCLSRHWLPIEQAAMVMNKYDKDHNGKLTFDEFVDMADDHQLLVGVLDDYLECFQALDISGSGRINRNEMRGVMETMIGSSPTLDQSIEKIFTSTNYNGDDSTICFSEFLELIRSHAVDLQMVLDYMKLKPIAERGEEARVAAKEKIGDGMAQSLLGEFEEPPEIVPGEVAMVHSFSQLETLTKQHPIVMLQVTFKWCRPCKMFAKKYRTIAEQFPEAVFLQVEGDKNEVTKTMLKKLKVKLSPTFIVYRNGEKVKSHSGADDTKVRALIMLAKENGDAAATN
eukprot:CAMPEP_0114521354 /NCGR_PEP_ID=MMETSP0109-20121206/20139_1 /TAXON_ID=29199 /ORGANISM="Chlorarachnion reptans, Strain CCCM449" /LENGTH=446 /DNA_ID=CAMNT_0001702449 /DNA_START=252 /DNA_END=1591 /DNA_ORIENTATION=+